MARGMTGGLRESVAPKHLARQALEHLKTARTALTHVPGSAGALGPLEQAIKAVRELLP